MNTYEFTCDILCQETGVVLFPDFTCDVEVVATVIDGQLDATSREVFVDGVKLKEKSALAQAIRNYVLEAADLDLDNAGRLWDAVAKAEGIYVSGAGGPDAHFYVAAE